MQNPSDNNDDLFLSAVKDVRPLRKEKYASISPQESRHYKTKKTYTTAITNQSSLKNKIEFILPIANNYSEGYVSDLDLQTFTKLQAGQFRPEAQLDLHGLNVQQSFPVIKNFFYTSYMKRYHTVLIISGQGKNSPQGTSVLKEKFQEWLIQAPLKRVVLAFCTAKACDGGTGAMYILLRMYQKTWKIDWKQQPLDPDLFYPF